MCLKTVLTKSPKEDYFFCIFVIENQTDNNKTINKRIMSSSICLLAVLLFVVAIGFMVAYFIRKHPEKISGFNVEEFDNDIVAATKWVNLLCRVTIIASFITLICGIIAVYLESILMFALSVSVPITVGFIYAYSRKKGRHNAKEGYVNKPLLIVISSSFILQLIVVVAVSEQATSDLDVVTNKDELVIKGQYGTSISYSEIKEITLKRDLPNIKLRSNGFSAEHTNLGNFITQDDSHIMLFTHSDSCFIRIVTKKDEIYYLSCQESGNTVKVFNEIKKVFAGL